MLVKICGIRRIEDINYVNELMPDYIGFVFVKESKRYIDYSKALLLKQSLNKNIKVVGVYLNQDIKYIKEAYDLGIIDLIQLHGNEDDNYIKELKSICNIPIINVYRDSKYATYLMYDSKTPGQGIKEDLDIKKSNKDIFIAGGINIYNLDEIKRINQYCVDVSSAVEVNGFKDYTKMRDFIRKVRE